MINFLVVIASMHSSCLEFQISNFSFSLDSYSYNHNTNCVYRLYIGDVINCILILSYQVEYFVFVYAHKTTYQEAIK